MKRIMSLSLVVLMALSIFAGLEITALADYGRVPYVNVSVTAPSVGAKPEFDAVVSSQNGVQVRNSYVNNYELINGVDWYDVTAGRYLGRNDTFVSGHEYTFGILVTCLNEYRFKQSYRPSWVKVNGYDAYGDYYMEYGYMNNEQFYYIHYTFAASDGWSLEGSDWYYYSDGTAATGWRQISGKWYFFNSAGVMQTGWVSSGGKWYYMDSSGAMKTGWLKSGGEWYFLQSSGAMATGWVKSGGKWYFMSSSGAMATGWVKCGGNWYYMLSSGEMYSGWLKSSSKWYYLDSNGAMLANTQKRMGNKVYKFNAAGVCTNP